MSKRHINQSDFIPNSFQVVNAYIDEAMQHLTPEEFKVLIFTTRHILGWQNRQAERQANISIEMYRAGIPTLNMGGTGLAIETIMKALNGLETFGFIKRVGASSDPAGQRWELLFNPDMPRLIERTNARKEANLRRIEAARQARNNGDSVLSDRTRDSVLSDKTSSVLSDKTSSVLSDRNNKTQDKNKTNTNVAATAATGTPSLSDKDKKPSPDALFNAVASALFGVKQDAKIQNEGHIAKARGVFAAHSVDASQVAAFVEWYRAKYPDAALVRDAGKLEAHVMAWLASSEKPAAFEIIEYHDSFDDLRGA